MIEFDGQELKTIEVALNRYATVLMDETCEETNPAELEQVRRMLKRIEEKTAEAATKTELESYSEGAFIAAQHQA